jgi:hypothetical protein
MPHEVEKYEHKGKHDAEGQQKHCPIPAHQKEEFDISVDQSFQVAPGSQNRKKRQQTYPDYQIDDEDQRDHQRVFHTEIRVPCEKTDYKNFPLYSNEFNSYSTSYPQVLPQLAMVFFVSLYWTRISKLTHLPVYFF